MAISSMTGFARVQGAHAPWTWVWEAKSVNGRGLEIRFRLPPGLDALEPDLRALAQKRLKRGNLTLSLSLHRESGAEGLKLNRAALGVVLAALDELRAKGKFRKPDPAAILAVRGVIEPGDAAEDPAAIETRDAKLLAGAGAVINELAKSRAAEGRGLAAALGDIITRIGALAADAEAHAGAQPAMLRERLNEQVALIIESNAGVSEERLAQELALLAAKADVREEIDRLKLHIVAAREHLAAEDAVGRKLEFLTQELGREANTICSKAADIGLTRIGLDLKAAIDQFREQIQNVE